jgi:hypothetical protein
MGARPQHSEMAHPIKSQGLSFFLVASIPCSLAPTFNGEKEGKARLQFVSEGPEGLPVKGRAAGPGKIAVQKKKPCMGALNERCLSGEKKIQVILDQ